MSIAAIILGFLILLLAGSLFFRIKAPWGFLFWFPRLTAGGLSGLGVAGGLIVVLLGILSGAPLAIISGVLGSAIFAWYVWRVTRPHPGFEQAFGPDWETRLPTQHKAAMLKRRWVGYMPDPPGPAARLQKDLAFCTLPGSDRKLLCDLWQPAPGVPPSGIALLFFHGSAWCLLDKDNETRPFFKHLIGQGHVVMDVSYRLYPESGIEGMVTDVKRAIVWMKANVAQYGVNPERIILGGGSAGGHISLLAAYDPQNPLFTPEDLRGCDLSVRGVVSLYGPTDLKAVYTHTRQERLVGTPLPPILSGPSGRRQVAASNAGRLDMILGGHPGEIPEVYRHNSPLEYIHPGCPPTLMIQGTDDLIVPLAASEIAYRKMAAAGVPGIYIAYPCTEHGFDLMFPRLSPVSQAALYEVERFIALLV